MRPRAGGAAQASYLTRMLPLVVSRWIGWLRPGTFRWALCLVSSIIWPVSSRMIRRSGWATRWRLAAVGEHVGLTFYTLGQRQGLGIGGEGEAWYVAGKDLPSNTLVVVQGHDHPALLRRELEAQQLSWTLDHAPHAGRYTAKTRYRQADAACTLVSVDQGRMVLQFDEPQWAVTPGQSVVLYQGEHCLGGGIIS